VTARSRVAPSPGSRVAPPPAAAAGPPDPGRALADARRRAIALLDGPGPLLVVSDFDGTLAEIRPEPADARIERLGRTALRRLARLSATHPARVRVLVLSGRGAVDVASHVRVGGLAYLGNHGLESARLRPRGRPEALTVEFRAGLGRYRPVVARLGDRVAERLGRPDWLFVEYKGPSVAFHFRAAPDPDAALEAIDDALEVVEADSEPHGLERFEGRKVIEFRPPGAGGKGMTMERLLAAERPPAVLVLGDDRSDAEAFEVVRAAREKGELRGLAVAVHGAVETPPEVVDAADVVLATPRDAARVLSALGREIERRSAR
jgi:trehalose 6-phosphate phosphatase